VRISGETGSMVLVLGEANLGHRGGPAVARTSPHGEHPGVVGSGGHHQYGGG
jgi:hypothetical protein